MTYFRSRLAGKHKALTLIELIVAIVILAIISAIAIPTFLHVINTAKVRTAEVTAKTQLTDAFAIARANGRTAPNATDLAQAVKETTTTAAGTGVLAGGSGTFLGKEAFRLTTTHFPIVASRSYGSVSAASSTSTKLAATPTSAGVAFMTQVQGTAVFAFGSTSSHITAWAEPCTVATSLVAISDTQGKCTVAQPPAAPSGVTATVTTTNHTTDLALPPASTATGFSVIWTGGSVFIPAGTTSAVIPTTKPITVSKVSSTSGTSQAVLDATSGGIQTVTTAPSSGTTGGTAPTVAYTCGSTVTVAWKAPATNGSTISSYEVKSTTGALAETVPGTTTTAKFTGLTTGASYAFEVDATNAAGTSPWSGPSNSVAIAACRTWTEAAPATAPTGRRGASMAYDLATGNVVLFGGSTAATVPFGTTWTWNGTTWTKQSPATSPAARYDASMAYDPATGNVVLFGGGGATAVTLSTTWTWNGTTWTKQSPGTAPTARRGASMTYDPATGNVVLFGGLATGRGMVTTTWTWNGTTWTKQSPATSATRRWDASMAYDTATGNVVLFGGIGPGLTRLATSWTWNGTTWTKQSPATAPTGRRGASMAYDPATGDVVLFGGSAATTKLVTTTWTWNGATWTKQSPATSPAARYDASMAYDTTTGNLVLFGGATGFATTWAFGS